MPDLSSTVEIVMANVGLSPLLGAPNSPLGGSADIPWPGADILSTDERERQSRLRLASDRDVFGLAHTLLRTELSRHARIAPQDWRFVRSDSGKPLLTPALMATHGLHFSLSHAGNIAVCAITRIGPVGVDVEPLRISSDVGGLTTIALTPREAASLSELDATRRYRQFLTYWTLKEAYTKACGVGLSRPMQDYSFHLENDLPPRLIDGQNDVTTWAFDSKALTDCVISAAVCTANAPAAIFRYRYSGFYPGQDS